MKKISTTLVLLFICNLLGAQSPLVKQWDYRYGGISNDLVFCTQPTPDGGCILGGHSTSDSSYDRTQNNWDTISPISEDIWIVKLDGAGNKQWDKRFGGSSGDLLYCLRVTTDGGYILGGSSVSGISGDKTQDNWGGTYDYWIVKIDGLGNKQWDARFGGMGIEELRSVQQTLDGGYILGGISISGLSGDRTEDSWGQSDYWIVKTDSTGVKEWDKRFGTSSEDLLRAVHQTPEGGYILAGNSYGGISGDKTEPSRGSRDYWIVKTDNLGNKLWDKRYGATASEELYSIQVTSDGGLILGGRSESGANGDRTQASWGRFDYWIVKTDSLGTKQWDKAFGGSDDDYFDYVEQTSDGGYLLSGYSYSPISGNKTEANLGQPQTWSLKTDPLGNKEWDKTVRSNSTGGSDRDGQAIQTIDGCYVMSNYSFSQPSGDKTQPPYNIGFYDYWTIKFCDSTLTDISDKDIDSWFSIYPNPFSSEITIKSNQQITDPITLSIKNMLGQIVLTEQKNVVGNTFTKTIESGFLPKGIYLLEINIDGARVIKKIIRQ